MRHSVHLMFGDEFSQSIEEFQRYIIKYGEKNISSYINTYLWNENTDKSITISSLALRGDSDDDTFISGVQSMYRTQLVEKGYFPIDEQNAFISDFFDRLFRETVTIDNPGDVQTLHLFLYLPLYNSVVWKTIQNIISLISELLVSYHIDIIGLAADTAYLFNSANFNAAQPQFRKDNINTASRIISEVVDFKKNNNSLVHQFLVLQNTQSSGVSLNLTLESYTRIIGELAFIFVQHYSSYFLNLQAENNDIKAVGLSVLLFDKYYFVQYLLKRSYLYLLEKEKITETKVDVTKANTIAQKILKDKINILSDFIEKEVDSDLSVEATEELLSNLSSKLDNYMKDITSDLQTYLLDEALSLPEKKAIMAAILGQDDELFRGNNYYESALIIDDLAMESANVFIKLNNTLLANGHADKAILSLGTNRPVSFNLNEIKKNREDIRQSTSYIRTKEEELERIDCHLEKKEESQKVLIEDGFYAYGDKRYKLIGRDVEETLFEKTYDPISITSQNSIDLRSNFTKIKDQGQLGACTAFALVGVYEYILKAAKEQEYDLSESFLYYNVKKKKQQQSSNCGTNIFEAYTSFHEHGVCKEYLHPYNENKFDVEPDSLAYENALLYRVKEIQNVKGTLDHIRTALAEGYPVIVSLNIYPSFSSNSSTTGFVYRPTKEEIDQNNAGRHAMIICGYSDERKIFIVRNSWGHSFGDKGYCYISYAYIEDENLLNSASIITQIESNQSVKGNEIQYQVNFDLTDALIQSAITKNLIEYEYFRVHNLQKLDAILREQYFNLMSQLENNRIRRQLTSSQQDYTAENIIQGRNKLQEVIDESLKKEDSTSFNSTRSIVIMGVVLIIIAALFYFLYYEFEILTYTESILVAGFSVILTVISIYLYELYRSKSEKNKVNLDEINMTISKYQKDEKNTNMKMHIAGLVLDRFFALRQNLIDRYQIINSFSRNLKTWYFQEKQDLEMMDANMPQPFISLLNNEELDAFFQAEKKKIVTDVRLCRFIESYEIKESEIIKFQKNVKNKLINVLINYTSTFDMMDYVLNNSTYSYLGNKQIDLKQILPVLDKKSDVFLRLIEQPTSTHKIILIRMENETIKQEWINTYRKCFSLPPVSENIISSNKLIIAQSIDVSEEVVSIFLKK